MTRLRRSWRRGRGSSASPGSSSTTLGLIRNLETNERFRRDGPLGSIFHPGRLSYREVTPRDSLHIIIDGDHVSAHVDDVCPLRLGPGAPSGYSWPRVLAHNVSGLRGDVSRRIRGLHGNQRCNLGCEMVWDDDDAVDEISARLDDDPSSAQHQCAEDET